jgi:hypothetical protein
LIPYKDIRVKPLALTGYLAPLTLQNNHRGITAGLIYLPRFYFETSEPSISWRSNRLAEGLRMLYIIPAINFVVSGEASEGPVAQPVRALL